MRKTANGNYRFSRLERRWVMLLAQRLMEEHNLLRREALAKAWNTLRLLSALGRGETLFRYVKEDGTLRQARGTLARGVSQAFDEYKSIGGRPPRDNSNTDGTYVYWDLDAGDFRSFRAERLAGRITLIVNR